MLIAHAAQSAELDEPGFVHAVALSVHGRARLASVHACAAGAPDVELPHARSLLSRWRMPDDAVAHDRIQHTCCESVDETLLDALRQLDPDLLVASTHARSGLGRLLFGSIAEGVARNFARPTLLLPQGEPGLVDPQTGALRLARALVPVGGGAAGADAQRALDALDAFARLCAVPALDVVLLHVDDGTPTPAPAVPSSLRVVPRTGRGPIDRAIATAAHEVGADLVVMTTHGHDSASDVLLASHTERVLHACRKPLLWVPAAG